MGYYNWALYANIHTNYSPDAVPHIASNSGQNYVEQGQQHSGSVELPPLSVVGSRSGYTPIGYSFDRYATTPNMFPGSDLWWTDAGSWSHTFDVYCIWSRNSYSVTFDANGGNGAPASQTFQVGSSVTLSDVTPTRAGYRFLGWSEDPNAATASYAPGTTQTFNDNVTLYAVWEANQYTISFNANGGTNPPPAQTKTYGESLTLTDSEPTRDGYEFAGWATSNTAVSADYQPGDTYDAEGNATLYAVWQLIVETHTLTYNANGGADAPAAQTQTYSVEDQRSFIVTSQQPTRDGHAFRGWSNTASGAVDYAAGDTITAAEDKTIYAVWEKTRFTITYDANGGTNPPAAQTKEKDVPIALTMDAPEKQSSVFVGWSTDPSATEAAYHGGDLFTANADTVLYAVWGSSRRRSVVVIRDGTPVSCRAFVVVGGEPLPHDVYVGGM